MRVFRMFPAALSLVALLAGCLPAAASNSGAGGPEVPGDLARGWIAQSYAIKIGGDAPTPTDLLLNTWVDSGRGLITTDYLFAFDSDRSYIFNAGILRSGALRIQEPGAYRLHVYLDRFLGTGEPECRARVAIDGSTIIDSSAAFEMHSGGGVSATQAAKDQARNFHQSQRAESPVFRVSEPGYYRMDFWSVCRDLNDKQAAFNLTNELGNRIEKRGLFGTKLQRLTTFYDGDGQITAVQKHRYETNPVKQVIAENHGTMFDLVLENVVTGERGRLSGDNIWHNRAHAPDERLEYQSLKPMDEGDFEASKWVFTGIRGDLSARYEQSSGYSPRFQTAAQQMPFVPSQVEARKRLKIEQAGVYEMAIGYEPEMSAKDFLAGNGYGARGGRAITREQSEPVALFMEKHLEDGRVSRLKIFEGTLKGTNFIGEIRFLNVALKAGEYDLVVTRNLSQIKRDRYGTVDVGAAIQNSQMSIRMKRQGAPGFVILN
ncbi:hypothetical protein [Citreimonas salinaria]|uniref:Uncharacterized protein n=1 Tax=Citreimonas salinaria TaxID=321339 RepID=A0A1H3N6E8_9RHOB|nr:hypothetical protein [Citreimonas salinaria]SDY84452.1 hypothetical protein SAMN05444340_1213 [Citreimonas salinaria]